MIDRPVLAGILLAALLAFVVLLGGTAIGETSSLARLMNATFAAALIVAFLVRSPRRSDRLDLAAICALVLFGVAGALSSFPRQSFDATLTALAYVAGLWVAREQLTDERVRRLLWVTFMALSAIFTIFVTGQWLVPTLEWWRGVGGDVLPPLNFELDAFPWGHRHDLTLLIAMLYPAWWIKRPSLVRRAFAVSLGILGIGILLVDGSRALWLAIGTATIVSAVPVLMALRVRMGIGWPWVAAGAATLLAVLSISGLAGAFLERATSAATLEYRAAMWSAVGQDWLSHPVQGNGPASFPWVLQLTGYFDTNSWAPRHPDSAVVQGLAEGGLLVLASMALIVIAVGWELRHSRSRAATWALITFGIASINANPTDFAFLVVVAIAWVAYAVPRVSEEVIETRPTRSWTAPRIVTLGCLAIIGVAYASTLAAAFEYDRATRAVGAGELHDARAALDTATSLDPSMALYFRQRGALGYVDGEYGDAAIDLTRATGLNPADDLGWRTLALALFASGDQGGGERALTRAVELQRSDPSNLLTTVRLSQSDTEHLLAEVVHAWPTAVFGVAWDQSLPHTATTDQLVDEALKRWLAREPIPEMEADQGIWLTTLTDRPDLLGEGVDRSGWDEEMASTLAASIRCEPTAAALAAMPPSAKADAWYWWLLAREDIRQGGTGQDAMAMADLMGRGRNPSTALLTLNPLNENAHIFSADLWGYRRRPVVWPEADPPLPSHEAGEARWLFEPHESAIEAAISDVLGEC